MASLTWNLTIKESRVWCLGTDDVIGSFALSMSTPSPLLVLKDISDVLYFAKSRKS